MLEWMKVLAAFVLPRTRWQQRLQRDLAVYSALPKGPERRAYKRRVKALSAQIIEYDEFPLVYKVVGWGAVVSTVGMTWGWGSDGPARTITSLEYDFGPGWPLMAIPSAFVGVWFTVNTLRGRVAVGGTPRQFQERLDAESRRNEAARRAVMIRRRARQAFKP